MARTLVNANSLAHFSGSTATTAKFAQGLYTGGMSMESGSMSSVGTLSFYDGGSISYEGSKIQLYNNTNIEGTLTANTSLTLDTTTITTAEIGVLDGVSAGTAAASKAVVLGGSKEIATIGTIGCGAITSTGNSAFAQVTTSGRVIVDDATEATTTTDGSLQTDGGLSVAKSAVVGVDLDMLKDGAVMSFGADKEVTLTHSHNGGLMLNGAMALSFGDSGTYIQQASDGNLKLAADGALLLSSDTVQVESANSLDPMLELKNTTNDTLGARLHFLKDKGAAAADDDIVGVIAWSGDNDAQEQTTYAEVMCQIADASNGTEGGKLVLRVASHDGEMNNGIIISDGDVEDEIDVILGNGAASTVTIPGNLIVTGTTTTVDVEVVNTANGVIFEGTSDDGNETTLKAVDPTADNTVQIANASGYLIPFAAASTTTISSTPAELNKLDGAGASVTAAKLTTLTALTDAEIGYVDGAAAGTAAASKAVVLDASADTAGIRNLSVTGDITIDDGGSLKEGGGTAAFTFDGSGHVTKVGQSSPTTNYALTWDGSKVVWSEAGVSGSAEHYSSTELRTSGDLMVSGSSILGDAGGDTHQVTGSFEVSGPSFFTTHLTAEADMIVGALFKMPDNTSGKFLVGDGTSYQEVALSGDATLASNGALTIAAGAVENSMLADDAVGADELAANSVVNASVTSNAAIDYSKLAAMTSARILVGNGSNVATVVAVSGDVTMANDGAVTIAAGAVEHGMLAEDIISGQAELAHADIADADDMMISDNGTIKKVGVDSLRDHFFGVVSGDATIADGGALTIAAGAVENSMLADDAVGADELAANAVVNASVVAGSLNADRLDIDGSTDIGADLVDADLFIVDDGAGGTNRKSTLTRVKKYIYSAMSGDATASDAGALTIAANAVEGTMLNSNCGGNGIAVVSNALTVDFAMERCIGSSGHSYTSASGVYTLPATPVSGSEMVFLNGQMLYRGDSTDSAAGSGDYTTATGSVELHADLKLDADDVLQVYFLL